MSALLALEGVDFRYRGATTDALHGVSLSIGGASVGIVGESGSGKSTALSLLLGLATPTAGRVVFDGARLDPRDRTRMREFRRRVQVVFQDPYSSLDPRQRVDRIVAEPLVSLGLRGAESVPDVVARALADVDLDADAARRYPHEFSGGQRQRIAIARALVTSPTVLLADEPVSALDVHTRIGVIRLLDRLKREKGLTVVMVSHDMSVVAALCEDTVVLKDGGVVEVGTTARVITRPEDPYTQRLIAAIPRISAKIEGR